MRNSIYIFAFLMLANCRKEKKDITTIENFNKIIGVDPASSTPEKSNIETKKDALQTLNNAVLASLKTKDYQKFANFIHPQKGVSFSMYAYVDQQKDKHFSREEFLKYIDKKTLFTWGEKDGTGESLVLSIKDYLESWVYAKDFTKGTFYLNEFTGRGNSLNNLQKIYSNKDFTENYLAGTAEYSNMDWDSLRFVFEEFEGSYYIIAVINDQWTI